MILFSRVSMHINMKNLEGNKLISDDVIRNTLKSVWPLPTEYEAGKMYKLYTTEGIYHHRGERRYRQGEPAARERRR